MFFCPLNLDIFTICQQLLVFEITSQLVHTELGIWKYCFEFGHTIKLVLILKIIFFVIIVVVSSQYYSNEWLQNNCQSCSNVDYWASRSTIKLNIQVFILTHWIQETQLTCYFFICDMIKGNKSHIKDFPFWVFEPTSWQLNKSTFWCKYHENWMSGYKVMSNLSVLKTMKNKRFWPLSLPISLKQYLRHATHSPRSCHIC